MLENENLVTEQVAENVEQTTEETPRTYTEAEFNERVNEKVKEVMGSKIARKEVKIRKEYDRKYGDLVDTLKAGTGEEDIEKMTDTFKAFYQKKGINVPKKAEYSAKDIEVLAKAEAEDVIRGGMDEVAEEVERLSEIGVENLTAREKAVFKILLEHGQNAERIQELEKIGVSADVYNSPEFKEFASQFNSNMPIAKIYDIYAKTQPKKEIKTAGSMLNTSSAYDGVKDFYTPEEARRFTVEDFNKNPALLAKVEESMKKWKR